LQGVNAFRDYQLPEAALALKQGVGRLIRSEEDRGVVMICDPRLTTRGYGRALLSSLPPMRPTREISEAIAMLRRSARQGSQPPIMEVSLPLAVALATG
jgi:ATP-dependent DNA helicase DinG